jgi:hypothetical protein
MEVTIFFAPSRLHLSPEGGLAAGPKKFIGINCGVPDSVSGRPKASFDVRSENDDLRRIVVQLI